MPGDPTTFDPHIRLGLPMLQSWPLVFDNILSRDIKGKIIPALATSWSYASPTVLELKLRKGVKFHNGEPVDANAVKYSLDRLFDKKVKSRIRNFYRSVKKVEVVDSHTVRIHTKHPDRYLLSPLADFSAVVPPKYYASKKLKHLARNPVGSGPYRLVKWRKGSEMVFEAVPGILGQIPPAREEGDRQGHSRADDARLRARLGSGRHDQGHSAPDGPDGEIQPQRRRGRRPRSQGVLAHHGSQGRSARGPTCACARR